MNYTYIEFDASTLRTGRGIDNRLCLPQDNGSSSSQNHSDSVFLSVNACREDYRLLVRRCECDLTVFATPGGTHSTARNAQNARGLPRRPGAGVDSLWNGDS